MVPIDIGYPPAKGSCRGLAFQVSSRCEAIEKESKSEVGFVGKNKISGGGAKIFEKITSIS